MDCHYVCIDIPRHLINILSGMWEKILWINYQYILCVLYLSVDQWFSLILIWPEIFNRYLLNSPNSTSMYRTYLRPSSACCGIGAKLVSSLSSCRGFCCWWLSHQNKCEWKNEYRGRMWGEHSLQESAKGWRKHLNSAVEKTRQHAHQKYEQFCGGFYICLIAEEINKLRVAQQLLFRNKIRHLQCSL